MYLDLFPLKSEVYIDLVNRPSPHQEWTHWTRTKPFCCHWKLSSVTSNLSVTPPCLLGLMSLLSLMNPPHWMVLGPHFSIMCSGLSWDTPGYVSLVMGGPDSSSFSPCPPDTILYCHCFCPHLSPTILGSPSGQEPVSFRCVASPTPKSVISD